MIISRVETTNRPEGKLILRTLAMAVESIAFIKSFASASALSPGLIALPRHLG